MLIQEAVEAALTPLESPPTLRLHVYGADRLEFVRPRDSYPAWTLLVPERGALRARLGDRNWEEVGFGAWVVCPPHTEFEREIIEAPLSFHFVRFEWQVAPDTHAEMIGRQTTKQLSRLSENLARWRALEGHTSHRAHQGRQHVLWDVLQMGWSAPAQEIGLAPPAMRQARALIIEHAKSGISLAHIAQQVQLSPVALTRQFRAAFDVTPSQFLLEQRLEQARHLLVSTDWPLDAIALSCGLGSGFYLSRVWSKQFGQSPARFRRERQI